MKILKTYMYQILSLAITYSIILFDTDGAQLGLQIWGSAPEWFISTASIFGNIIWLFGALLFIVGGILIYIVLAEDKMVDKAIKEADDEKRKELLKINYIMVVVSFASALFAIGSGFWFTGTGWLLALIGAYIWRNALIKKAEELDLVDDVEKKWSAKDEMKKSLLDD